MKRYALLVATLCLTACGPASTAATAPTPKPTNCPAVPLHTANADSSLPDNERKANIDAARSYSDTCYAAWFANLDISTIDFTTVEKGGSDALYTPPENTTLGAAVRDADLIVDATFDSIAFKDVPGSQLVVTMHITRTLKGSSPTTVKVIQTSQLAPQKDWHTPILVEEWPAPLILPGDRLILFLKTQPDGMFAVESFTGMYYVHPDNTVAALGNNPFHTSIDRTSLTSFADTITKLQAPVTFYVNP